LYQSNLVLDKATITSSGIAEVYLTGELKLGGTCDVPRAQAQLEQTIRQFSSVNQVKIYLNGQPLDQALSSR
ncbi:GerMN domain-containing protein, partial [Patescibacteria group bacterium]|nr:GerMN domain-containing protein [Patescibacteria group bacterium]